MARCTYINLRGSVWRTSGLARRLRAGRILRRGGTSGTCPLLWFWRSYCSASLGTAARGRGTRTRLLRRTDRGRARWRAWRGGGGRVGYWTLKPPTVFANRFICRGCGFCVGRVVAEQYMQERPSGVLHLQFQHFLLGNEKPSNASFVDTFFSFFSFWN